jgi:hypothetical protein
MHSEDMLGKNGTETLRSANLSARAALVCPRYFRAPLLALLAVIFVAGDLLAQRTIIKAGQLLNPATGTIRRD